MMSKRSPWHLSEEQISRFDQDGFLHLPARIEPGLLARLQEMASGILEEATEAERAANDSHPLLEHTSFVYSFAQPFLKICQNFHLAAGVPSLEVLAQPQILAAAESLCGPDFFSVIDVLTFKQRHDNSMIDWHQDNIMPSPKKRRSIAVGIYLDDSAPGDGAVSFVPGSQGKRHDWPMYQDSVPEQVAEPAIEAGDILIHDLLTVHKAGIIKKGDIRRTIYQEFRSVHQILEEEKLPRKSVDNRIDLMETALEYYRTAHSKKPQFHWNMDPKWRPGNKTATLDQLYEAPLCFMMAVPEYLEKRKA